MHFIDIPKGKRNGRVRSDASKPILKRSSISTATTDASEVTADLTQDNTANEYDDLIDIIAMKVASELVHSHTQDEGSCEGLPLPLPSGKSVDSNLDIQQIAESLVNSNRRCDISESRSLCSGSSLTKASEAVFHPDFWCVELLDLEDEGSVLGALSTHSRESGIVIPGDDYLSDSDDISVVSDITSYIPDAARETAQTTGTKKAKEEPEPDTETIEDKIEKENMLYVIVQFSTITVREYPVMMGENPAVSDGPPLTIDWEYNELPDLEVEAFESVRRNRRTGRSLLLSREKRECMLRNAGYEHAEIVDGIRHVKKVQAMRRQTIANLGSEKVEEAIQKVSRRVKGMLKFGLRSKING